MYLGDKPRSNKQIFFRLDKESMCKWESNKGKTARKNDCLYSSYAWDRNQSHWLEIIV